MNQCLLVVKLYHHLDSFMVAIMTWLRNINVTDHHGYVRYVVQSQLRPSFFVLDRSANMTYQQIFTIENTRCATGETGTAYPSRSPLGNNYLSFGNCLSFDLWLLINLQNRIIILYLQILQEFRIQILHLICKQLIDIQLHKYKLLISESYFRRILPFFVLTFLQLKRPLLKIRAVCRTCYCFTRIV